MMALHKVDGASRPLQYWRVIQALHRAYGHFRSRTILDIIGDQHKKPLDRYLAFLLQERVIGASRACENGEFTLLRPGDAPPFRGAEGQRQQALWTAMRGLRSFTAAELAVAASTEQLRITRATAATYVRDLLLAGYIAKTAHDPVPAYRLLPARNTGPRAPIVLRGEPACFDLNLMREVNVNEIGRAA